jgi:hypothetical protein
VKCDVVDVTSDMVDVTCDTIDLQGTMFPAMHAFTNVRGPAKKLDSWFSEFLERKKTADTEKVLINAWITKVVKMKSSHTSDRFSPMMRQWTTSILSGNFNRIPM